jgi:metallo-beta-lactamase class B
VPGSITDHSAISGLIRHPDRAIRAAGHTLHAGASRQYSGAPLMPRLIVAALSFVAASVAFAQSSPPPCEPCAEWNVTQKPFRLYGNAYYVGVRGLSAVLITSDAGHILIDGDLPESAPKIVENIRALGFRIEDVKLLLNSHVHYDHAGGLAELQRLSGAKVAASAASAKVLREGKSGADDPQFGILPSIPKIARVEVFKDDETLRVGSLAVTAHLTPGHTPGGTTWTWQSCEQERCLDMVYADSLTPVSAPDFKFTASKAYPAALQDFEKSYTTLENLPCDLLVTTHPEASDLWTRLDKRERGDTKALIDPLACDKYVAASRERLRTRIKAESGR